MANVAGGGGTRAMCATGFKDFGLLKTGFNAGRRRIILTLSQTLKWHCVFYSGWNTGLLEPVKIVASWARGNMSISYGVWLLGYSLDGNLQSRSDASKAWVCSLILVPEGVWLSDITGEATRKLRSWWYQVMIVVHMQCQITHSLWRTCLFLEYTYHVGHLVMGSRTECVSDQIDGIWNECGGLRCW